MHCVELDRISPTRRPEGANSGTQNWRELLFLHWTLPPEALRKLIPAQVELDLWDGQAYVGMVPFRMEKIRPSWLPGLFAMDFLELNLRTYVHFKGRPAVWFFSLEASSWLAVNAARTGWSLPYHHATMKTSRAGQRVLYDSARKSGDATFVVDYEIGDQLGASVPGTLEYFLLERYLLLSERRGKILEGQVHHTPYVAHRVKVNEVRQSIIDAAGMPAQTSPPACAHFSPGVDVEVFGPYPVG
jgi:uncharacterized protein YqjF (DUF2071 family)